MLTTSQSDLLRASFKEGSLLVRSVSPVGDVEWKRVLAVHRAEVGPESIWEAHTEQGPMVLTGGHKVFTSPTEKQEMETLHPGTAVLGVMGERVGSPAILSHQQVADRQHMYDLTAEDWHNFVLHRSGVVISNSPDRTYHFRPPTGEGTIGCHNQVFGAIWEDEELLEFLIMALDQWNAMPPETEELCDLDSMSQRKPSWKAPILWGAVGTAAMMLAFRWTADEFDYSIGGISLSIDKSSKYQSLKENAEQQFEKLAEAKARTTKYMRGLKQQRFSPGVRSAFGPYVGSGVLSPRGFMVFLAYILPPMGYTLWYAHHLPALLS